MPLERPLFDAHPVARAESLLDPDTDAEVDVSAVFGQTFVDQARLAAKIRLAVPARDSALLSDILRGYPNEHGAAEIVGYLALTDDDLEATADEHDETCRPRGCRDRSPRHSRTTESLR